MEALIADIAPSFDSKALREEFAGLMISPDVSADRRAGLVNRLRPMTLATRDRIRARLEDCGDGRRCAADLSDLHDELVRLLFHYTVTHVYPVTNPSDAERMAIVATGGYGRGLLAPASDIDLLFLLPYKQTPWGESVAENILYALWDLGLKVGHATRNVDQCLHMARSDMTIRTALLDARLVDGEMPLFEELQSRFRSSVVHGTSRAFIDAKMAERDERHRRAGESRYLVEPNVKDGKGGLRDIHTLRWLTKYLHLDLTQSGPSEKEFFTASEYALFRRCEAFLWTVRCHLHFLTGRPEERLSFDVQPQLAEALGYRERGGLRAVERFMKHYFLVAKDVGDLTTILCSALEMEQVKGPGPLNRLLNPLSWRTRHRIRQKTDFRIDNDRLNVADPDVFKRDPVNLIRFFAHAHRTGAFFHPSAVRRLRPSLRLVDDKLRSDPEANRIFLELLTAQDNPEAALRRMNEAGVLGRFIPEFGRVVSMMQFSMYHHFTVDEHLIRTVGELAKIERGALVETLPLSTKIFSSVQGRRALYVAAFLHDIAKGHRENHSVLGAAVARRLGPRLGLSPAETETVAWLIEQHLTMSVISQSRDLGDPKTIRDFAAIVQTPERLNLLLLLTVADIRAVGPGTWNGWKGQLLRTLYYETEQLVGGAHASLPRDARILAAQAELRRQLAGRPIADVNRFIARHYPDYWLKTDTRTQVEHAKLAWQAEAEGRDLATAYTSNAFNAMTDFTVLAPNHPRLLSLFAGCCAAAGANIIGAQISTTRDGMALDTFTLQREFADEDDEARRIRRIGAAIDQVLKGEVRLAALMARRRPPERRIHAFKVTPEVLINDAVSDQFTVIEVSGRDRPGLLYDLTSTISDLNLDIASAHITTYGEKAVDVFYVTDLTGKKIAAETRRTAIKERLEKVLAGEGVTTS